MRAPLGELIANRMAVGGFADRAELLRELNEWRRRAEELDTQLRLCNEKSSYWREQYAAARTDFDALVDRLRYSDEQRDRLKRLTVLRDGLLEAAKAGNK